MVHKKKGGSEGRHLSNDAYGDKAERASKVTRKTFAEDEAEAERRKAIPYEGSKPHFKIMEGATQMALLKKTGNSYERTCSGAMLTEKDFSGFSAFFTGGGLALANIKCSMDGKFQACKNLQDVEDAVNGKGRFQGKPVAILTKRASYSWKLTLTQDQYNTLADNYRPGPSGARGHG